MKDDDDEKCLYKIIIHKCKWILKKNKENKHFLNFMFIYVQR